MKKLIYFCIALGIAAVSGCSGGEDEVEIPPVEEEEVEVVVVPPPEFTVVEKAAAAKISNFGIDFLAAASKQAGDVNMAVSPYSVATVLSMCANVADEATKGQILELLGTADIDACNSLAKKNMEWLPAADAQVNMTTANGVWYSNNYTLNPTFSAIATDVYKADQTACNFTSPSTSDIINEWVGNKTNNLIPHVISAIDPETVAMFVNALHFKGAWTKKFYPSDTYKAKFEGVKRAIAVDMMNRDLKTRYAITDHCQAVWLGYGSGQFSMVCILPNKGISVDELLAMEEIKTLYSISDTTKVYIELPKFKIEQKENTKLNNILASMGCDNLGLLQNISLFTQAIEAKLFMEQRVFMEVNENGTEAAASTHLGWASAPEPPKTPELYFNRPFIFLITEMKNNTCLFAGKIVGF